MSLLYKWVYTNNLENWFFIYHDGEKFLGWRMNRLYNDVEFHHNNYPFKYAKQWFSSVIPKYQKNQFVEKKGWSIFRKKGRIQAKRKMIKDILGD